MTDLNLWSLALAIFAAVVVVVALLLGLIIAAAKSVDRHAAGIWVAGKQIAGNTVAIWMLDQTNDALKSVHDDAGALQRSVRALDDTLRAVARAGGAR
jgi:hypothetical protein